jgi:hypothetical protein
MGLQAYTVSYTVTNGASWVALTDVQSIQFSIGRNAQLDQIKSSFGSFEMRYPTGFASPVAALVSGTIVRIQNTTGTPYTVWLGKIDNVNVEYGIPYSGGVGPQDHVNVTIEGAFAALGRMQGNGYAMAAGTIAAQMTAASTQTGLSLSFDGTAGQTLAATTVNSTWGDWVNRVCQSTNSRIWDSFDYLSTAVISPFSSNISTVNFSDVANNATNQVYNQINFDSLADNFYTQITVTPESFGAATVIKSGATIPYRTYQTNTLNASTAQATDYANYLLGNYGTARFAISSFSCTAESQNSFQLDKIGASNNLAYSPGTQVNVAFRGTIFSCVIEGINVSATPAGAVFTYYVSGADLNAYLRLGNDTFGRIDFNRLGY